MLIYGSYTIIILFTIIFFRNMPQDLHLHKFMS